MNTPLQPRHIDELMQIFQADPTDDSLSAMDMLRLAYEFQKLDNTDSACLLAGIYTAHLTNEIRSRGLIRRAEIEYAEYRYEDCIKTTTELLKISPSNVGALCLRAIAYGLSRRDDRAERSRTDLAEAGRILTFAGGDEV